MKLCDREWYDLMAQFEKQFRHEGRLDREASSIWPKRRYYQDGRVNDLFIAFTAGYALGTSVERLEHSGE
ncbi:MAG: hypothetical protein IPH13_20325 [Planctomycetes bacterium]|nr:hypothetical protein [Planctomycetota bacterium]